MRCEPPNERSPSGEVIGLSQEAWSDAALGCLEVRVLRACRVAANDNGRGEHGIAVIRADVAGPAVFFVIKVEDRLMRAVVYRGGAKILSSTLMPRIGLPRCDREA
jgi:hypothetical protein